MGARLTPRARAAGATHWPRTATALVTAAFAYALSPPVARGDDGAAAHQQASPPPAAPPLRTSDVDPREIDDWPPGRPPPPGYHWGARPRRGILATGTTLLFLFYFPSFLIGTIDNNDLLHSAPQGWLLLPVVGPFALLGDTTSSTLRALLIADGVAQATGAAMIAVGLAWRIPVLVRDERTTLPRERGSLSVGMRPAGFFVGGTF